MHTNIRMGTRTAGRHRRRRYRRRRRAAEEEEGTATSRPTGTITTRQPPTRSTHRIRRRRPPASRALVRPGRGLQPRAPVVVALPPLTVLLVRTREASITATRANANIPHLRTAPR